MYALRYADTDPYGRGGVIVGEFDTRDEAERVRKALPSPVDVVEVDESTARTEDAARRVGIEVAGL